MKQPIIKILTRYTLQATRFFTRYTLYATRFFLIIAAIILYTKSQTIAADPPHSSAYSVYCNSCHSVHKASGTSLTNNASNANLCQSCHNGTVAKPLDDSMLATPGTSGTSHSWDANATMPAVDSPDNQYGLRPTANLTSAALKGRLTTYGNVVTCSVCHNQHGQASAPWDPNAPAYSGQGTGSGRHFQRISDDLNQMCEDCHYYRTAATTGTNVRTYDEGYKKSHPVVKIFSNAQGEERSAGLDGTQFNTAPLEPSYVYWGAQTGTRYNQDGAGCSNPTYTDESSCTGNGYIWAADNNVTNNIIVDSSKKTRCLSCHGIHYTDSSSGTIDDELGAASGDGYLLKRSPEETCHVCHKTNLNTKSPGETGYVEAEWNNAIKMHSTEMFGTCSNTTYKTRTACINASAIWTAGEWNTSGGWGVAGGKYGEIVCTTCHTAHDTKNIYLIKETITSPNSPTDNFPGGADSPVDFRSKTAGSATGTMGWEDGTTRTSSTRVCEACHTYNATDGSDGVKFHGYSVSNLGVSHQGTGICTDCHSHKQAFSGGGCTGCHGYPPVVDTAAPPDGLAWTNPTGSTTAGAHNLHYTTKSYPCTACHYNSSGSGATHGSSGDSFITMGFYMFDGTYQGGNYDGQTTPPVDGYNVTTTSPPTTITTPSTGAKTCSLYCHGSTLDATTLPVWSGTISCGSCHTALQTDVSRGSHARHARSAPNRELACTVCHSGYTSVHVNGSADWAYDTTTYSWLSGALYNGLASGSKTPVPSASYNTCSNLYCHSDVQTDGGGATTYLSTPQWGGTVGCSSTYCHGGDTDPNKITTGSHTKHIQTSTYNYSCSTCHTNSGINTTKHADHNIDVSISVTYGGSYSQSSNPPANGYGNCSSVYCHSNGKVGTTVGAYTNPAWDGAAIGCNGCHGTTTVGGTPDYANAGAGSVAANSHDAHAKNSSSCVKCHSTTTTTGTTITGSVHINNFRDVASGGGATFTYVPQTCSTISCHFDGTAQWGATLTCNACHGLPPNTGAHLTHTDGTGAAYGNDSNSSSTTAYRFNCGNCHPIDSANHANGTKDVELYYASAPGFKQYNPLGAGVKSGSGDTTVCENVYCHSNGADGGNRAYKDTPTWSSTFGANKCGGCHDNPPQYAGQSHYNATGFMGKEGGHLVGIHFDNIYNGTSGVAAAGTGDTNSHGNSAYSTTISCYICHNDEVSSTTIDTYALYNLGSSSMKCSNCHPAGAVPLQNGAITDKSLHINAAKNVSIADAFTMNSKAQLRDASKPASWTRNVGYKTAGAYDSATINSADWNGGTKTCTTACHNGQAVTWGDTNATCYSCHKSL